MTSIADVLERARRSGVSMVRFEYCDFSGVARAKNVHVSVLENKLHEGVGFTRAQNAINLLEELVAVEGMEPVGEIRMLADPSTFTILPWAPGSASVLCDQVGHDLQDWGACPRLYLKRMVVRLAEHGLRLRASFEDEYYVVREVDGRWAPYDAPLHAPVYSMIGLDFYDELLLDTVSALEAMGLQVESAINEYGPGQLELAIRYADALDAADHQMRLRDAARGVAAQHGLVASFAPKPFPDQVGSGAHIHFSIWDAEGTTNLLYDADAEGSLSVLGRHVVAGLVEHLPGLIALTAPSANSHRRLAPSSWAPATTAWGFDNREVAVRVASPFHGREQESVNIEYRASDSSSNPYLALGGLIACVLDGVERMLEPAEPARHDPALLDAAALASTRAVPLPSSMAEALDALERDPVITATMPELLVRGYLAVRRAEAEAFAAGDVELEQRHHLHRF